jgi:hypothetical protein
MYVVRHFEAPVLNSMKVRGQILSSLQRLEKDAHAAFDSTVATWNHEVKFDGKVYYAGGDAIVEIGTDDIIWKYIDEGTSVRHAKMEEGFVPKTRVRRWGSVAGQGGVVSVSKKMNFRGIEGREWTLMAQEEYGPRLEEAIDEAIDKALGLFI